MRIVINALAHKDGGGITYLKNILPKLHEVDSENNYKVLLRPELGDLGLKLPDSIQLLHPSFPATSLPARLFWEQVILPVKLKKWGTDVLFSPTDTTSLFAPCPVLLAIRNPNPYVDQDEIERSFYGSFRLKGLKLLSKLSVEKASKVFFVSHWSKRIIKDQFQIPEKKSSVIYHGLEKEPFQEVNQNHLGEDLQNKLNNYKNFILSVSTINPHKNFEVLLDGYSKLHTELKGDYELVIAGKFDTPDYYENLERRMRRLGIESNVHFLGEVDYEAIPYLYNQSSLFVLPSKLETFGHTLIEAMASGTPLIASDSTAIPEITGNAAQLFNPENPDELSEQMEKVLENPETEKEMIEKGFSRSEKFSWKKTAEQTLNLLKRIDRN